MRRALVVALALVAAGCGGEEETAVTETVTAISTVVETVTVTEPDDDERPAVTSYEGVTTPSGNIECVVALQVGYSHMRCTIVELDSPPPRPAGCEFDWGHYVTMDASRPARWACVSDAMPPDRPSATLAYGETWRRGAFECRSSAAGLRCENAVGHALFLSRERQRFDP